MKGLLVLFCCFCAACTATQITQAVSEADKVLNAANSTVTTAEVGDGLKEALIQGISKGSDQVSQIDGYFKNPLIKIPFPPDVKKVETKLRQIGLGNQVDHFVMTMNRGAEDAAAQAKPIFIEAIKQMTIQDAWGILKGQPDAATQYLKRTTTAQLKAKFTPVIQGSLSKTEATKYYGEIVNTYNKIPFVERVNPDLTSYATDLAIQGLFNQISNEEKNIRQNPAARTSDLLQRVFAAQQ